LPYRQMIALKDAEIGSLKAKLKKKDEDMKAAIKHRDDRLKRKDEEMKATIQCKDDEIALLKGTLKNSKIIDTVDLTTSQGIGYLHCTESSGEIMSPNNRSSLAIQLEQNRAMVRVKQENKDAKTALEDVRDDLDIAHDTLTLQTVFTDGWQSKFDEVASLAAAAGVGGFEIAKIRERSFSGRP